MAKISLRMFACGIFLCLAFWWAVAQLLQMPVIPSPELVLSRLVQKFPDTIAVHAGYSLMRIVLGLLAAVAVGYPAGVLMGYFPCVNRLLAPILYLTYPVPKIALLPVAMLLFGVGEASKLLLVFLMSFRLLLPCVMPWRRFRLRRTRRCVCSVPHSRRSCVISSCPPRCRSLSRRCVWRWRRRSPCCSSQRRLARSMALAAISWMRGCA